MRLTPSMAAKGRWSRSVGALFLIVCLGACGSGRATESKALVPQSPGDLDGTAWLLVATGDFRAVPQSTTLTLRIEGNVASGNGPCNSYRVSFVQNGDDVTTGKVTSTKKACSAKRLLVERKFFRDLQAVDTAEKDNDQLVLTGPRNVRLVFDPAKEPASALAGNWNIVNIATPSALTTPIKGTHPTLSFDANGTSTVETGCNTANTTWKADGSSLTIDPLRSTLKACPNPPGVNEQEARIFDALPRSKRVELSNGAVNHDTAALLDANGTTTLVIARQQ